MTPASCVQKTSTFVLNPFEMWLNRRFNHPCRSNVIRSVRAKVSEQDFQPSIHIPNPSSLILIILYSNAHPCYCSRSVDFNCYRCMLNEYVECTECLTVKSQGHRSHDQTRTARFIVISAPHRLKSHVRECALTCVYVQIRPLCLPTPPVEARAWRRIWS